MKLDNKSKRKNSFENHCKWWYVILAYFDQIKNYIVKSQMNIKGRDYDELRTKLNLHHQSHLKLSKNRRTDSNDPKWPMISQTTQRTKTTIQEKKKKRRERCSNLSTLTDDLCFFETQNSF